MKKKLLVLVGPTASGKTELAFEISKRLPVEMISCDSMQVYRKMPIITQAPPRAVTKSLKTHLVSFLDPSKEYNAAIFRRDALSAIQKILRKNKTPLIAGGTGLYLRALLDGLFEADPASRLTDKTLRQKLLTSQETHGGDYLHRELQRADPLSAKKIHPNDFRRIIRALEVTYLTGKPFSAQKANRKGIREEFLIRGFFLDRDRQDLYDRINRRVDEMLTLGLLQEVRKLLKLRLGLTAGTALGIREMKSHLDGKLSLNEGIELLKKNTRNYAKRQLSWFRHEKGLEIIPVKNNDTPKKIADEILRRTEEFSPPPGLPLVKGEGRRG